MKNYFKTCDAVAFYGLNAYNFPFVVALKRAIFRTTSRHRFFRPCIFLSIIARRLSPNNYRECPPSHRKTLLSKCLTFDNVLSTDDRFQRAVSSEEAHNSSEIQEASKR
ncbi:hypothetical protein V3C99_006496 [Haemonchus contortus]